MSFCFTHEFSAQISNLLVQKKSNKFKNFASRPVCLSPHHVSRDILVVSTPQQYDTFGWMKIAAILFSRTMRIHFCIQEMVEEICIQRCCHKTFLLFAFKFVNKTLIQREDSFVINKFLCMIIVNCFSYFYSNIFSCTQL